jgi:hypothetical protein
VVNDSVSRNGHKRQSRKYRTLQPSMGSTGINGLPQPPTTGISTGHFSPLPRQKVPGPESGVYVLRRLDKELFKIGCASVLPTRIAQMRKQIKAFTTVECTILHYHFFALETALHRHFVEQHVGHEWFRLTPADLEWLAALDPVTFMEHLKGN